MPPDGLRPTTPRAPEHRSARRRDAPAATAEPAPRRRGGNGHGEPVISLEPCNLLDEVLRSGQVGTPRRRADLQLAGPCAVAVDNTSDVAQPGDDRVVAVVDPGQSRGQG